jgi:hypothetical protein
MASVLPPDLSVVLILDPPSLNVEEASVVSGSATLSSVAAPLMLTLTLTIP